MDDREAVEVTLAVAAGEPDCVTLLEAARLGVEVPLPEGARDEDCVALGVEIWLAEGVALGVKDCDAEIVEA